MRNGMQAVFFTGDEFFNSHDPMFIFSYHKHKLPCIDNSMSEEALDGQ